jgi:hypothetical protein
MHTHPITRTWGYANRFFTTKGTQPPASIHRMHFVVNNIGYWSTMKDRPASHHRHLRALPRQGAGEMVAGDGQDNQTSWPLATSHGLLGNHQEHASRAEVCGWKACGRKVYGWKAVGEKYTVEHGWTLLGELNDGWPESEKNVFQAALRMVVVKECKR